MLAYPLDMQNTPATGASVKALTGGLFTCFRFIEMIKSNDESSASVVVARRPKQ